MKAKQTKNVAVIVIVVLLLVVIAWKWFNPFECYDDIIDEAPGRQNAPQGYDSAMCGDPNFYDWTQGDCVRVDDSLSGLRWRQNTDVCACIPNDWEPSTIPKMLKVLEKEKEMK